MIALFKDPALQAQIEREGWATVRVLEEEQINELLNYYRSIGMKDEKGFGFHISMDQKDSSLVGEIIDKIYEVVLPQMEPVLNNAQVLTASFVIKEPNPHGVVPAHQDWSFVEDGDEYNSLTCWIPLVDVTLENGAIGVIRGSHRFFHNLRPSPIPQVPTPLANHQYTLFPYLHIVELKAGEAILFDNRTFHASPPNTTNTPRVAVGLGFTQKSAETCHYFLHPQKENKLLKYKVDEAFFRKYNNVRLSAMYDEGKMIEDYPLLEEVDYDCPDISTEELLELIKQAGNSMNTQLVERLAGLFSSPQSTDTTFEKREGTNQVVSNKEPKKPFWKIYTPLNIYREIVYRLTKS